MKPSENKKNEPNLIVEVISRKAATSEKAPMYFITCFTNTDFNSSEQEDRTFGYFYTFEDAVEALKYNELDMHEYYYYCAFVEKIYPGIHATCKERWFFVWDEEKEGFFPAEEPENAKRWLNFAIG